MIEPYICIIILNWNAYEVTRECLLSLIHISYLNYTIILVDNGSSDNSVNKLSEEFKQIYFLKLDKNYGFTGGNNKGIVYTINKFKPDYILLLNNDTEVNNDFLSKLIIPFMNDETIYATVPKICFFDKKNKIWYAGGKVSKFTGIVTEFGKNKKDSFTTSIQRKTGFINGCAVLLSIIAINNIGLLDEMFFAYSEDTDYSLRILKSEHSMVYVPESVVYHKVSHTFRNNANWFKYYLATRNIILLQRKHLKKKLFPLFVLWFYLRWVLYLSVKLTFLCQTKSVAAISQGFYDGLTKTNRYEL